jgi:predicted lipid-binding transport protein (Tim44 family)
MVLEMQRIIGQVGSASTIGRTLQWTALGVDRRRVSSRTVQVTVTPRNGRTTIQIHEPMGQLAGGLFGGLMGGLGGSLSSMSFGIAMSFHSGLMAIPLVASAVGGSYLLARTIFGRMVRSRGDELQRLMSRLVDHVSATAAPVSAPASPTVLERPAERGALERGE